MMLPEPDRVRMMLPGPGRGAAPGQPSADGAVGPGTAAGAGRLAPLPLARVLGTTNPMHLVLPLLVLFSLQRSLDAVKLSWKK